MNKQTPLRVVLNLVLIVIVVISVIATVFLSVKGYHSNRIRIPEICSDDQIVKEVKEQYTEFEFSMDDDWDIETHLLEDDKSFTADVNIIRASDISTAYYGVQLTFKYADGSWGLVKYPYEISLIKNEWNFENSEWTVTAEDGTTYEVTFLPDLRAELSIQESADTASTEQASINVLERELEDDNNATDEEISNDEVYNDGFNNDEDDIDKNSGDSISDDTTLGVEDQNGIFTCNLTEVEDGTKFHGTFEIANDESVMLIVTTESVKIVLSKEGSELILTKK